MTSRGLKINLRLIPDYTEGNVRYFYGALACHEEDDFQTYGGIPLLQHHGEHDRFFRDPCRPLAKIPVAAVQQAPLRTVYITNKAMIYPTADAFSNVVPQHFLLRYSAHEGQPGWKIHAQPLERWNPATRTMQFRGVFTVRTAIREGRTGYVLSFAIGFGVALHADSEGLNSSNEIFRPYVYFLQATSDQPLR